MKLIFTDYNTDEKIFSVEINEECKVIKKHPTFYREHNQALKQLKLGNTSGIITDNIDVSYMKWCLV